MVGGGGTGGMTTGRGSWQSLGGNSVGRRVSVLAWKCACSEMSPNPAGSEPGGAGGSVHGGVAWS